MHSTELPSNSSAVAPIDVAGLRALNASALVALDGVIAEAERVVDAAGDGPNVSPLIALRSAVRPPVDAALALTVRHCEDDERLLWPLVSAAAGAAVDLGPLRDDHRQLHALLARAAEAVTAATGDTSGGQLEITALIPGLHDLRALLGEHLADEERDLLPALVAYVRREDFAVALRAMQAEPASGVPAMRRTGHPREAPG